MDVHIFINVDIWGGGTFKMCNVVLQFRALFLPFTFSNVLKCGTFFFYLELLNFFYLELLNFFYLELLNFFYLELLNFFI